MALSRSAMADADERILSYHDAILHRSDLADLSTPSFLSDRVLHFYFTHLSLSLPNPSSPTLLLLPPSLSFLLSNVPIPIPELDLPSKTLILFPVNDNTDVSLPNGGSHWSLLVFYRPSAQFVHHDSSGGHLNSPHAKALYFAVRDLVGSRAGFVEGFTPRQQNGYDCGVYVTAIAKAICEWHAAGGVGEDKWFGAVRDKVDEESVARLRREVLGLVRRLMQVENN